MKYVLFMVCQFSCLSCQAIEICLKWHIRSNNLEKVEEENFNKRVLTNIYRRKSEKIAFKCHRLWENRTFAFQNLKCCHRAHFSWAETLKWVVFTSNKLWRVLKLIRKSVGPYILSLMFWSEILNSFLLRSSPQWWKYNLKFLSTRQDWLSVSIT